MYRTLLCSVLSFSLIGAVVGQDRVTFLDRTSKTGGTLLRSGSIVTEDPGKVTLTAGDNRRSDIPVSDIIDVLYDGEPVAEMNAARAAERDRKFDVALAGYTDAMKKVTAVKKLMRRHLEYKIAEMRAAQAETGSNPTAAIDALRNFIKAYPDSRQSLACLEQLGRLVIATSQSNTDVIEALAQIRAKFGTDNKEIASRCDMIRSDLIMQELEQAYTKDGPAAVKNKAAGASKALAELVTIADRTIQPDLVARQTYCQALANPAPALAAWEAQLKGTEDPHSRASIHLTRGDFYRMAQNYKEAMWDYLWVDTVYFADRQQQAKALYHLAEVFDKLGDTAKSRDSKDRLLNDGRLRDTRYNRVVK